MGRIASFVALGIDEGLDDIPDWVELHPSARKVRSLAREKR